jgi:hypothetical protein
MGSEPQANSGNSTWNVLTTHSLSGGSFAFASLLCHCLFAIDLVDERIIAKAIREQSPGFETALECAENLFSCRHCLPYSLFRGDGEPSEEALMCVPEIIRERRRKTPSNLSTYFDVGRFRGAPRQPRFTACLWVLIAWSRQPKARFARHQTTEGE